MHPVGQAQNNVLPPRQQEVIDTPSAVNDVAILLLNALGGILIAAGAVCMAIGIQFPPIAVLVAGIAVLILACQAISESKYAAETPPAAVVDDAGERVDVAAKAFGRAAWLEFTQVDPGEEPPLPANIETILKSPCPFWPAKTVADTHILVLVPKQVTRPVDGGKITEPYTLNALQAIRTSRGPCYPTPGTLLEEIGNVWSESHWVLMTRGAVPGTKLSDKIDRVEQFFQKNGYEIPGCLDTATAYYLEGLRSGNDFFLRDSDGGHMHDSLNTGFKEYTAHYELGKGFTFGTLTNYAHGGLSINIGRERPGFAGVRQL